MTRPDDEPRRDGWMLPALLGVTAATFAVTVTFPFTHWDDPRYAWKNPLVEHPLGHGWRELLTTPALGYPQGLTVLSYAAQRAVFGPGAWSFHLVNVALHLANVAQVFAIGRKLSLTRRLATGAAMLFALHPVVAEPVSWVTGRKDLLATALLLLAARLLLRGARDASFPSASRWSLVSLVAILGMWAKPSTTVAAVVLGLIAFSARPGWPKRALATALAPLLLAGAFLVAAAGHAQSAGDDVHPRQIHEAVLDVLGAVALQLSHLVWPTGLVSVYTRIPGDPSILRMIVTTTFVLVGLFALTVLARRNPRSPTFAAFASAAVAYAPMSNVLAVNRWTADSYVYLPLAFLALGLASCLGSVLPLRASRVARIIVPALGLALAANAFAQTSLWRTPEAVWLAEIDRYPTSPLGFTELARTLGAEGHDAAATEAYIDLDQRFPDVEVDYQERAMARWNRGDGERAVAILESGVGKADLTSSLMLWSALFQGRVPVDRVDSTRVGQAFDNVFPGMMSTIDDERVWQKTIALLDGLSLQSRADRVRAARSLAPARVAP